MDTALRSNAEDDIDTFACGVTAPPIEQPQRVVVVSNRLVLPGEDHAGGLAQAIAGLFKSHPGTWIGWSGRVTEDGTWGTRETRDGDVTYVTEDIPRTLFEQYYHQFANRVLWPLLHGRCDLLDYEPEAREGYMRINERFASSLAGQVRDGDLVWIHDYHLLPLASMSRSENNDCRYGFFFHTPVPPPQILRTLPDSASLFGRLSAYDLIGVQTPADAAHLCAYLIEDYGARKSKPDTLQLPSGAHVQIGVFPVGVDCDGIQRMADNDEPGATPGRSQEPTLIAGVDRLDYTKGIEHRIETIDRLLRRRPALRGKIQLRQIASISRGAIPEYRALARRTRRAVDRVNRRYGSVGWTPVHYLTQTHSSAEVVRLLRRARVGLVTPMRDGMNLVAKEYVAAQNPLDPGVLVLSSFAGAAYELCGALLVNPHDREGCASAIERALTMPRLERRQRWQVMMTALRSNDVHHWARSYIAALAGAHEVAEEARTPSPKLVFSRPVLAGAQRRGAPASRPVVTAARPSR